jgi:malate dehydrogenase (oxaloacetate-decarboxylating)(NADP+)
MITKQEALEYHYRGRHGKIEVCTTKPCVTQKDLSIAYTPGVAEPCREIEKNPEDVFKYTAKGNLVAVVSNGTAVLGLGDIGPAAGKPVMEGKGVLFKRFADIDVFDLELDTKDPDEIINLVSKLEPTFGGINLEDIKAPECFYIEEQLKKMMDIPVFHDDQHGTAIISGAGLLNAVELVKKRIDEIKIVVSGAGAAGIACSKFYIQLGARKENIILCDSKGVIYKGRKERMNPYKEEFAAETNARTLEDAMKGADMFCGVSAPNVVTKEMVRSMADNPIIFAMANPDPEITYEDAMDARDDVIMATGRSDYPNQVNNVLGFPFIFRGALDVRATAINENMKVAAAHALADLTKEPVPYTVIKAYRSDRIEFGRDYIIPKPFDPRVLLWEASAVAKAAIDSGVARINIDIEEYKEMLEARLGMSRKVMRVMINKAKKEPKRIVYPEGEHVPILKACEIVLDEGMAHPILLGNKDIIQENIEEMKLNLDKGVEIIDPLTSDKYEKYAETFYELRHRKGITYQDALRTMKLPTYFGSMMVHVGDADGLVEGLTKRYPETLRPALQIIGVRPDVKKVAGIYMMILKNGDIYFFADTTVNIDPSAEDLTEIALLCAKEVRRFDVEPRVAMVSFSNFGSTRHALSEKVREATEILDTNYPFSTLKDKNAANVLIFPDLETGNVAYKLLQRLGGAEAVGPILVGMRKPVQLLEVGSFNEIDVVNMTAIAVIDAQDSD